MTGKELFAIWAPPEHERWTRFAKPSLFVHVNEMSSMTLNKTTLPMDIFRHRNDGSAFILDLPGVDGIESGLALAELGFVTVPLYNGINEPNIGGLAEVVNNGQIADALYAGREVLKTYKQGADSLPVFLLDYNRGKEIETTGMYDNRWSVEPDDMPSGFYFKTMGIKRVVVWTMGDINKDLLPILDSYREHGIEISTFCDTKIMRREHSYSNTALPEIESPEQKALKENVRKFENARFGLLLIAGMSIANFLSMFFTAHEEPFIWTSPAIQWLTYDIMSEGIADIFTIVIMIALITMYFLSQKKRGLIIAAFLYHAIDTVIFFIYVAAYGFMDFMETTDLEETLLWSLIVFGIPIVSLVYLAKGFFAQEHLRSLDEYEYLTALDSLDGNTAGQKATVFTRHFRGYRGYGGSGRGGYRGSGSFGGGGGFGG